MQMSSISFYLPLSSFISFYLLLPSFIFFYLLHSIIRSSDVCLTCKCLLSPSIFLYLLLSPIILHSSLFILHFISFALYRQQRKGVCVVEANCYICTVERTMNFCDIHITILIQTGICREHMCLLMCIAG